MGYPMTWGRLINRNGLADGDYGRPPEGWAATAPKTAWSILDDYDAARLRAHSRMVEEVVTNTVEQQNARIAIFAGDLRRLEKDTLDEGTICQSIARKLDADPDLVAAVLKEWLAA